jgi:ribosomal protein S18 acetylase RimI-like enzyme
MCQARFMSAEVRDYQERDEQCIVELSLRAWEPVFEAISDMLGPELFAQLRGDWRATQATAVREALDTAAHRVWVAEQSDGNPIGFTAARLDRDSGIGEIYMIAVDPDVQDTGIGMTLTNVATDWLQQSGMRVAMIETGGDPGHAPARHLYQKAGYTALPAVRFFKSL